MQAQLNMLQAMQSMVQKQRDAMGRIYTPDHPDMKHLDSQLAAVAAEIDG
jgi:uncharacterized protein involved in exopolysaccharide biosynthesis